MDLSLLINYLNPAQIVGIIASGFIIIGYGIKHDTHLKIVIAIGATLFSVHFFMIGAFTAMMVGIINIFRVMLSIKFHGSWYLFIFFITIYTIAGALTYQNWYDLFPIISAFASTTGMYLLSGIPFRIMALGSSFAWLSHNIAVLSIGGIITTGSTILSLLSAIIRLYFDKHRHKQQEE